MKTGIKLCGCARGGTFNPIHMIFATGIKTGIKLRVLRDVVAHLTIYTEVIA